MSKRGAHRTNRPSGKGLTLRGGSAKLRSDPRLLRALHRVDANGFTWEAVADDILPVFERARPFSFKVDPPALTALPPGVSVGFGVDAGPAFMRISTTHLATWPIDVETLAARALANLRERTRRLDARDVRLGQIEGIEVDLFESGDGWASTTVLLPDAMGRLFGPGPNLFVAPWRDLLIRLPADVDLAFATWLTEELEAEDPNALRLEAFEWRDGVVRCRPLLRDAIAV
jgi:hypothetical protein